MITKGEIRYHTSQTMYWYDITWSKLGLWAIFSGIYSLKPYCFSTSSFYARSKNFLTEWSMLCALKFCEYLYVIHCFDSIVLGFHRGSSA